MPPSAYNGIIEAIPPPGGRELSSFFPHPFAPPVRIPAGGPFVVDVSCLPPAPGNGEARRFWAGVFLPHGAPGRKAEKGDALFRPSMPCGGVLPCEVLREGKEFET